MVYVNDTGLPSVTDVLSAYIATEWMTAESRERGTAVHEACFSHLMGDYVVPLREGWQGYFDSFRRWVDIAEPVVIMAEKRLIDQRLGYCGQMDFVGTCKMRDGNGLIDWKTSLAYEKWFRLQGAAYRHLAGVNGVLTDWGGSLRLKRDGGVPLFNYWPDGIAADLNRFMGALTVHNFLN